MKTIKEELETAIQNIANSYGVILGDISVKWINASDMDAKRYLIGSVEISNSNVITPVIK